MPHRSRPIHALILAAAVVTPAAADPPARGGVEIVVEVTGLRNQRGTLRACLTADRARFPRCNDDAGSHRLALPVAQGQVLRFQNVRPGTYAIALLHDENGNGRADRALSMIPREGFGFSRDAPVRMGPPAFADAAITVAGEAQRHTIRMRYML